MRLRILKFAKGKLIEAQEDKEKRLRQQGIRTMLFRQAGTKFCLDTKNLKLEIPNDLTWEGMCTG